MGEESETAQKIPFLDYCVSAELVGICRVSGGLAFAACGAGFYFPKGTPGSVECGGGSSWQGCSRKVWNKVKC